MIIRKKIMAWLLTCLTLMSTAVDARECKITPHPTPDDDQARLDSGIVGDWNNSFQQDMITITDLDGKQWEYFALQKKPENNPTAPLVLFLHGFPEFALAWENQLADLGSQVHAVAIDLKGHHYSSAPDDDDEYNYIEIAWEIRFLINCLGYEKAIIVGHDFGGGIAWTLGMLHPDIVSGLVILNAPHPYLFGRALLDPESEQQELSKYIGYAQGTSWLDTFNFYKIVFSDFSIFDSDFYDDNRVFRLAFESWLPGSKWWYMKSYYRAMPFPATEAEFPAELSDFQRKIYTVRAPIRILWGDKDPYFSLSLLDGLKDLAPNAEVVHYPNATHWINHEATDLSAQIADFVQTLNAGTSE